MLSLCSVCSAFGLCCKEQIRAVCPKGRDVAHVLPAAVLEYAWSEAGISEGFRTWIRHDKKLDEIRLILCQRHTGIGWKHCSVQQELRSNMFYWRNSFEPEWTKRISTWSSRFGIDLAFFHMQIDETWNCFRRLFCCSCQDAEDCAARDSFARFTERALKHLWPLAFLAFLAFFIFFMDFYMLLFCWMSVARMKAEGRERRLVGALDSWVVYCTSNI